MRSLVFPEENVPRGDVICLAFAFCAGLVQGFLGCLLAWVSKRKMHILALDGGATEPRWLKRVNVLGVVASATLPGVLSIAALAFGAISMVVVVRSASILVFNVAFTRLFRLGSVKRNDAVGTALCVLGVVALFKVAPTDKSVTDLDYVHLLSTPVALVWNCVLVAACAVSVAAVHLSERTRKAAIAEVAAAATANGGGDSSAPREMETPPLRRAKRSKAGAADEKALGTRAAYVSLVVAASSAAMDLSAKGYTGAMGNTSHAFLGSPTFWTCLLVFICSAVVMRGYYVYGCKACDVLVFIPLNTMLSIVVSAATGFSVMEEWRTVRDWDGFVTSYLIIFLGVYLLCSKEARDKVSLRGGEASATLLEVQQLCADMYSSTDKAIAIGKFELLVHKALQLGEVESTELVALVVALLNELPDLPKGLIGDWLQLAYPTIFIYVQDTSSTPGPQRHARVRRRSPLRMNRFLPSTPARSYRYHAMLHHPGEGIAAAAAAVGLCGGGGGSASLFGGDRGATPGSTGRGPERGPGGSGAKGRSQAPLRTRSSTHDGPLWVGHQHSDRSEGGCSACSSNGSQGGSCGALRSLESGMAARGAPGSRGTPDVHANGARLRGAGAGPGSTRDDEGGQELEVIRTQP